MKQRFVNSLFETRMLLSQLFVTCRVYRQYHIRQSSQSHMTDEVIRPGISKPRDACYVNTYMQLLFHHPPPRSLIVAWPNRNLVIFALHLMFVAILWDRVIDAVSLSTACELDVFDGKDCFELGLQTLGVLRDASSGTLRDTIQQLFCSRQITRFSTPFFSRRVSDQHSFFWHIPVSGPSTWIECLNSCLRVFNLIPNHLKHNKISLVHFPGSSSSVLVATYGQTIIWREIVATLPFRLCLIWLHMLS
jgi:hypothetical protein